MSPEISTSARSFWLRPATVAVVVVLVALAKLIVAARTELALDEGYYTFWSFALQPGYLDHPPAVAVMIALGRSLVGNSEIGVRLFPVLSGIVISAALYRIGAILFDRNTAALATLWYNLTLAFGLGFIMTPDIPSVLFWTLTIWAVAEFMHSGKARWFLMAGAMAGLGLWSKYTVAFLAPGLMLFVLASTGRRQWLRRWQLWAAPLVTLAVFFPVILWNYERDWASFRFQGQRTAVSGIDPNWLNNLLELVAGQALFMVPILAAFVLIGMGLYFRQPTEENRRGLALPILTSLPALVYFLFHCVHARVEANWLLPLWPMLTLVGAWAALNAGFKGRFASRSLAIARRLQAPIGALMLLAVFAHMLWQPFGAIPADRTQETRGWRLLHAEMARLAHANGVRWIGSDAGYGVTGELASYGLFTNDPMPVRQVNEGARYQFLPPLDPQALGWPALLVTRDGAATPDAWFGSVKALGSVQRRHGDERMERYGAYLVDSPTAAFLDMAAQ